MTVAKRITQPHSWMRLDGVDVLRGLAILFVLMNHVNMRLFIAHIPYTEGLPEQLVSSLVWNGQNGVQIFFAVSGFLITSTTLRRWGSLSAISVRDCERRQRSGDHRKTVPAPRLRAGGTLVLNVPPARGRASLSPLGD
jgi:hypothetical protein